MLELRLLANHFPALHGLRVLGILGIIQIHLSFEAAAKGLMAPTGWVYVLSQKLWMAMDLFFVLSGFLIGNMLLGSPGNDGLSGVARFYARRSFRIFPLYYVVLTALAQNPALAPSLYRPDPLRAANLLYEYLYLTNYVDTAHVTMFWGWSLCVEEHFYLLVPVVLAALSALKGHRARVAALAALFVSAFAVRLFVAYRHGVAMDGHTYFLRVYIPTHTRYDTMTAGVLVAYVMRAWGDDIRRVMARPAVRSSSAGAIALCFFSILWPPPFLPAGPWALFTLGTLTSVAWGGVVIYLLSTDGAAASALGAAAWLKAATLGYGVYLVHVPVVLKFGVPAFRRLVNAGLPDAVALPLATFVVFAVSALVAYVLHLVVEKPAMWLRDRVAA